MYSHQNILHICNPGENCDAISIVTKIRYPGEKCDDIRFVTTCSKWVNCDAISAVDKNVTSYFRINGFLG